MTDSSSIEETLKGIVTRITHCKPEDLTADTTWESLKADSLDIVQMLVGAEEAFGIQIPDEDAQKLGTFGDMVNYITSKTSTQK